MFEDNILFNLVFGPIIATQSHEVTALLTSMVRQHDWRKYTLIHAVVTTLWVKCQQINLASVQTFEVFKSTDRFYTSTGDAQQSADTIGSGCINPSLCSSWWPNFSLSVLLRF